MLGASNLTRGLVPALNTVREMTGPQSDMLIAAGHGRSFGRPSTVLGRTLPGIVHCGLWQQLEVLAPGPSLALITDVGNDIVYGAGIPQILGWVESCLSALSHHNARIVLTGLPVESIARISAVRFGIVRSMLFPRHRANRVSTIQRVNELNRELEQLASGESVHFVPTDPAWYGLDPIHIRRRMQRGAWRSMLAPLSNGDARRCEPLRSIRFSRPETWSFIGRTRTARQPRYEIGPTRLWLY